MSSILAFMAEENEGKSSTLNVLVNLLTEIADCSEIYRESDVDTCAWFKINQKYIYVGTEGDEAATVRRNIKNTEKYDCIIGIVASRMTGETAAVIKKKKDVIQIKKECYDHVLPKKMNNNAKDRIIAVRLLKEIMTYVCPQIEQL